jgi:ribosomal protein S18 acetylase RimI-like enzyme
MDNQDPARPKAPSPAPKVSWRKLGIEDLPSLIRIADVIHPGLPESREVFAERINVFPAGCLALVEEKWDGNQSYKLCGYAISHPIRRNHPPALNSLIGAISPDADQYYIHDIAILPEYRGYGLAQEGIAKVMQSAQQFATTGLVSVYGTAEFWRRLGFVRNKAEDEWMREKLKNYGDDAVWLDRVHGEEGELAGTAA